MAKGDSSGPLDAVKMALKPTQMSRGKDGVSMPIVNEAVCLSTAEMDPVR